MLADIPAALLRISLDMNRLRAAVPLLILIAIGVALLASGALQHLEPRHLVAEQERWTRAIDAHPLLSWFIYVLALTVAVATGMPGGLLIILAGGMLFGMAKAIALSAIGEVAGSLLLFLAARHAFRAGERPPPKFAESLRRGYQAHPVSYTLFLRFVPLFPFGGVSVALAWLRCPVWLFTLATLAGGCVMLVFETAIGAGLAQSLAEGQALSPLLLLEPRIWLPLVGLALLALIPVALQRLRSVPTD
jgi:uncharacterized membrane protein YdjX (TVP38/TMEM64 family)